MLFRSESEEVQNQISELEDEKDALESEKDVYDLIENGTHYDMTSFEVKGEGEEWAVGTYDEIYDSAVSFLENLYQESGVDAFRKGFADSFIDEEKVVDVARDVYSDDIYQNPESYFDDSLRNLSNSQEEKIAVWENKIEEIEDLMFRLEELRTDDENKNQSLDEKIDELNDEISELESEIESERDSPEGNFPDELVDDKIEEMVDDVRSDPLYFLKNYGFEIADYIDEDELIKSVIDTDGFGMLASYDGNVEEVEVQGQDFYIFRID